MSEIYQPAEDSFFIADVLEKLFESNKKDIAVLEIGCGSGVQLQKILQVGVKKENIFGVDINKEAVRHCKNLGFNCVHSNLFDNVNGKFDIIIFNPPYLPEDIKEPLSSKLATTGGKQGGVAEHRPVVSGQPAPCDQRAAAHAESELTKGINF